MAQTFYDCSLANEQVQVLVDHIILDDRKLGAKRVSPELRYCSHISKGECPVKKAEPDQSDVEGFPYSGTSECAYLVSLRHHD